MPAGIAAARQSRSGRHDADIVSQGHNFGPEGGARLRPVGTHAAPTRDNEVTRRALERGSKLSACLFRLASTCGALGPLVLARPDRASGRQISTALAIEACAQGVVRSNPRVWTARTAMPATRTARYEIAIPAM